MLVHHFLSLPQRYLFSYCYYRLSLLCFCLYHLHPKSFIHCELKSTLVTFRSMYSHRPIDEVNPFKLCNLIPNFISIGSLCTYLFNPKLVYTLLLLHWTRVCHDQCSGTDASKTMDPPASQLPAASLVFPAAPLLCCRLLNLNYAQHSESSGSRFLFD